MLRHPNTRRRGSTLAEQTVVLTLIGLLATIGIRGISLLLNAQTVHRSARDIADLFALARDEAAATASRTAIRFDVPQSRIIVHAGPDTLARYELAQHGSASMSASRDSMAYTPAGLGFGSANLRVILSKGASAETLNVSRLGRVRR